MNPDDPRHGTNRGWRRHQYDGEAPCDECRLAHNYWERHRRYAADLGRPLSVPSIGVQRRVRALMRLGWSGKQIAQAAGWSSEQCLQYAMKKESCLRGTWLKVAEAYDRMSMTLPPERTSKEKWQVSRTRGHAERSGWPPPLAWDNIDDPNEHPKGVGAPKGRLPHEVDRVRVERLVALERIPSTRAEKEAAMARWIAGGGSEKSFCDAHGWAYGRYAQREDAAS